MPSDGQTRHGHQSRHTPPNDNAGQPKPPADPQHKAATPGTNNTGHQKQHRRRAQHNERAGQGTHSTTPQNTHSRRRAGKQSSRKRKKKKKKGGGAQRPGATGKQETPETTGGGGKQKKGMGGGQQDARAQGTQGRKTRKAGDNGAHRGGGGEKEKKGGGRGQDAKAQGTRGRETRKAGHNGGAARGRRGKATKKTKKPSNNHKQGNPSPEGAEQAKSEARKAKGKVRRTITCPGGRPARPGQAGQAHAQQPGSPPEGRAVGGRRAPDPGRPTTSQEAPPAGTLVPPPQRAKPARKSVRCGVGDGSPGPRPPAPTASG